MKEILRMGYIKENEYMNGLMVLDMKAIFKIIELKEKEFGYGLMVINIMDNLLMGNIMDLEF